MKTQAPQEIRLANHQLRPDDWSQRQLSVDTADHPLPPLVPLRRVRLGAGSFKRGWNRTNQNSRRLRCTQRTHHFRSISFFYVLFQSCHRYYFCFPFFFKTFYFHEFTRFEFQKTFKLWYQILASLFLEYFVTKLAIVFNEKCIVGFVLGFLGLNE